MKAMLAGIQEDYSKRPIMFVLVLLVFDVRMAALKLRWCGLTQLIQLSGWFENEVEWKLGSLVRQGFVDPSRSARWMLLPDRKRREASQCSLLN